MMKLLALAGVVAVANAQTGTIQDNGGTLMFNLATDKDFAFTKGKSTVDRADVVDAINKLRETITEAKNSVGDVESAVSGVADQVAEAVEGFKDIASLAVEIGQASDALSDAKKSVVDGLKDKATSVDEAVANREISDADKLAGEVAEAEERLEGESNQLEKDVTDGLAEIVKKGDQLMAEADKLDADLQKMEACNTQGKMYDVGSDECKEPEVDEMALVPRVQHGGWTHTDGRDAGYVDKHQMAFEKKSDDTFIRVFYYDNMRTHGHISHGKWWVMICDADGNGCGKCTSPGELTYWRWSGHQHNWWVDDYVGGLVTGLCKASERGPIRKGKHMIKIMINSNRYDLITGHNQYGSVTIDEVYVA